MARSSSAGYNSRVSLPSQTARVKVLFFGRLKEIVGHAEDSVDLPDGAPIEALFSHYGASHPELARFRASLVASRNQEFAPWSTPLHAGDEVAFLPPVSGG
jgi:molybdopterin synthase sulfur carrier subunit